MDQPSSLVFPRAEPPPIGEPEPIAPGVLWLRLTLPFALDHVNIYLIADGEGWAVLDTGIADAPTRAVWDEITGRYRLTRLIVTHFHPDHVGLAGWMSRQLGLPLAMPQTEYLFSQNLRHNPDAFGSEAHRRFYLTRGLDEAGVEAVAGRGHHYLRMTTGLPPTYTRLMAGETLDIGGRGFEIFTGAGHAPEQAMLLCRAEGLFFAADQVLAKISPNIGVWPIEPEGNPLGLYLRSLRELAAHVPAGVLVLPAHNLPFRGLHTRLAELIAHHDQRCSALLAAAATAPRSTAELVPALFHRPLDPHQLGFAFGETQAHVNLLLHEGRLTRAIGTGGVERYRAVPLAEAPAPLGR